MGFISIQNAKLLPDTDNEVSIINRREIMPLLAKAWQVLTHYNKAMDCSAAVLDRSGKTVKTLDYEKQMRYCEFCKKHFHNLSQVWQKTEIPCEKIHLAALAESRRNQGVYIYACDVGFIFWTNPLYRNGRYAGALTAGQVIFLNGRGAVIEKFRALCKDKIAVQKFSRMIQEVPEKNHEEIQAMAQLLGVCAEEISESGEEGGELIRRMAGFKAWQKVILKNPREPQNTIVKKTRPVASARPHANFRTELPNSSEYPLEKERMLLAAFRRGDNETGGRILKELMDYIMAAIPGDLEIIRFRAVELVVLLSRAAVSGTSGEEPQFSESTPSHSPAGVPVPASPSDSDVFLETNNRYLRRIQESKTAEELIENLHLIAERMAGRIFSFQGIRHASVLRKAERYIWENYTRKLSLEEIARALGLSAPYFSTVFKEEMGENLSSYLNRLRVEKATTLLTETGKPLCEIAGLCGFEDQSWFSKIFKSFTGVSPGKFRENGGVSSEFRPGRNHRRRKPEFSEWNTQDKLSS